MAWILPNSVFLHVPKAGGSWVQEVITQHQDEGYWEAEKVWQGQSRKKSNYSPYSHSSGHQWLSYKGKHIPGVPTDRPAFCFVRHPLSWYRSYWIFRTLVKKKWMSIQGSEIDRRYMSAHGKKALRGKQEDFIAFLEVVTEPISNSSSGYLSWMYNSFANDCKYVGKSENMREDLASIWSQTGDNFSPEIVKNAPLVNTAAKRYSNSRFTIPLKLARKIMDVESEVVERFDYDYLPPFVR